MLLARLWPNNAAVVLLLFTSAAWKKEAVKSALKVIFLPLRAFWLRRLGSGHFIQHIHFCVWVLEMSQPLLFYHGANDKGHHSNTHWGPRLMQSCWKAGADDCLPCRISASLRGSTSCEACYTHDVISNGAPPVTHSNGRVGCSRFSPTLPKFDGSPSDFRKSSFLY